MGARVLVVDDSPTIRKVVTGILGAKGYDAVAASDGEQALKMLMDATNPKVALVLLDFVMPKMSGYEFCRRVRADEALKALPVVLMSAKTDKIRAQFVEQTGALDAISKPFDPRALLAVVEGTLQKVEAGRTARKSEELVLPPDSGERPMLRALSPEEQSEIGAAVFARALAQTLGGFLETLPREICKDREALATALTGVLGKEALSSLLGPLEAWGESSEVLRGRGDAVPLGEILQVLQMQLQSGILVIQQGRFEISVVYRKGLIDIARSRGGTDEFRLGRYLVEEGLIAKDRLDAAVTEGAATRRRLGDVVVDRGLVSKEDLSRALIRQSSELIFEVLRWKAPRYSFRALNPDEDEEGLGLPVASLVMEGFRRVDEWRLIEEHIDFDGILFRDQAAIEKLGDGRLSRAERTVLDLVDGVRPVREVVSMSHASSFDACHTLYRFLEARLVRRKAS